MYSQKIFITFQNPDLPANTSVRSHKFSEVTSSGRSLSYIMLPRPLLGTISFSMMSYWSPLSLDVGRCHLSRLLSPSVSLGTMLLVVNLVASVGGRLLGLVLLTNPSAAGSTVATWMNIRNGSKLVIGGSKNVLLAVSVTTLQLHIIS